MMAVDYRSERRRALDFYRGSFMLFTIFHHVVLSLPGSIDIFVQLNPFAELFVLLSGFVVGSVFLRDGYPVNAVRRAAKIFAAYYAVAIPLAVAFSQFGASRRPVLGAVWGALSLSADPTWIGILRFYGLVFLILPLMLNWYRKYPRILLYSSASLFFIATFLYQARLIEPIGVFQRVVILTSLQWQFFFICGLATGDLLKRQKNHSWGPLQFGVTAIAVIAFFVEQFANSYTDAAKMPYTFEKYINLLWAAPLAMASIRSMYVWLVGGKLANVTEGLGRNSLKVFIYSEAVRVLVNLTARRLGYSRGVLIDHLLGLFVTALAVVFIYAAHRKWFIVRA
jgi:hypothetical protein